LLPQFIANFVEEAKGELAKFLEATSRSFKTGFPLVFIYKREINEKDLPDIVQYVNLLKYSKVEEVFLRGLRARLEMKKAGKAEKACVSGYFSTELKGPLNILIETLDKPKTVRFNQRERVSIQLIVSPFHKSIMLVFMFKLFHVDQGKFPMYSMIDMSEYNIRKIIAYAEAQLRGYSLLPIVKEELDNIFKSIVDIISP